MESSTILPLISKEKCKFSHQNAISFFSLLKKVTYTGCRLSSDNTVGSCRSSVNVEENGVIEKGAYESMLCVKYNRCKNALVY